MAITARLAAKELYRLKLSQVDLSKADLRLGEKAHASLERQFMACGTECRDAEKLFIGDQS